jgi:hypothetical protein
VLFSESWRPAITQKRSSANGRVAEWLKAPDSKSEMAFFAMFSYGEPSLICSMFIVVLCAFAVCRD